MRYIPKRRETQQITRPFLLVLLIGSVLLSFFILRPFLNPIIIAILLATLLYPIYKRLVRVFRGRRNIPALLVVVGGVLVIVIPVFFFLLFLLSQAADIVKSFISWVNTGGMREFMEGPAYQKAMEYIRNITAGTGLTLTDLPQRLLSLAQNMTTSMVNSGIQLFGNLADLISKFFILTFLLFFLLRDGAKMVGGVKGLMPMKPVQKEQIFDKIRDVSQAVVFGTFAVAVVQGVLGGIGLTIVGLPGLMWGTIVGFSSMVPIVGTSLVTVPIIAYLFLNGMIWEGVFFTIWGSLLVGGIDNFIRPFLMRGRAEMPPFYIFLAVIGGIATFGLPGLIYGPLIIAFTRVMFFIYKTEYKSQLTSRK